ncbi:hypothetical protein SJX93_34685 [Streptomyces cyaneofuscatus]|uniref:hypothetical protein n=1 Tax=Streptomyces cyaneofuscatus TaxID=66883 RepID=UPI002D77417E|nr:hypothetical protein [Streptomyces cyaneofuscatus]WRO14461.1 hypothetical protein SJX93_34685 [Streptomyces cyaneofuscatus]
MLGAPSDRAEGRVDIRIIKRVVDGGTNVIVGVSKPVTFPIRMTVKGKLSRASWKDLEYHGVGGQKVTLQFRKAGATSYKNVATVKVISAGDSVKLG